MRDHALPHRGFGLSTPRGAGRAGTTPSNTGRRRQRKRTQRARHQPSSEHTLTRGHRVIRDRSPNQQNISGQDRAHSITGGGRTARQEKERIQEPALQAFPRSSHPGPVTEKLVQPVLTGANAIIEPTPVTDSRAHTGQYEVFISAV
jgi:hypothetical protein